MRNIICRFHKNQKKLLPKIRISLTMMSSLQCENKLLEKLFLVKKLITIIKLHKLYYVLVYDLILCFVRYLKNTSSSLDAFCYFMAVQCQTRSLVGVSHTPAVYADQFRKTLAIMEYSDAI